MDTNMHKINYVQIYFSLLTSSMILVGVLMNLFERYLPIFIIETFRYGKFASKEKTKFAKYFEVPKSSFKDFYTVASILYSVMIVFITAVYVFDVQVPKWIITVLDFVCGSNRIATTTSTSVLVVTILLTLQCFRRYYDTHYVSIFSKNGRINLSHYIIGMTYYPACMLAILCEAPKFCALHKASPIQLSDLSYCDIFAVGLFLWSWWHQHVATVILANLRRNKKGVIVTEEHKLPTGDWFKYLSAPHSSAEIVMYFALTVIIRQNITWAFVFAWVLSNQVETIMMSHWWYQEKFHNFPKDRKALLPFIY